MREQLAVFVGQRRKFRATFSKYSTKHFQEHIKITLLLLDVTDCLTQKIVTDHLWFTMGKRFGLLGLKEGEQVEFEARVDAYYKGYIGHEWGVQEKDYHLEYPTKLRKLAQDPKQAVLS